MMKTQNGLSRSLREFTIKFSTVCITLTLFIGIVVLPFVPTTEAQTIRYFQNVSEYESVARTFNLVNGPLLVEAIELHKITGTPITGDTVKVWIQHYSDKPPSEQLLNTTMIEIGYKRADFILSCFPERLPKQFRNKHLLKNEKGIIVVHSFGDRTFVVYTEKDQKSFFVGNGR